MPELPEVETVTNEIRPYVLDRVITGVVVHWPGTVRGHSPAQFSADLEGRRVTGVFRRGKYIVWELDDGKRLLTHLKMTGSLIALGPDDDEPPYVRVEIRLDDGRRVIFRDPRKFGRMALVGEASGLLAGLGPEPLAEEFTAEVFESLLRKRKSPVKAALLDQTLIAGIGNMYADEALHSAGIHPLRLADSLDIDEYRRLYLAIRRILRSAIDARGASISNYIRPGGDLGHAHFAFKVAHKRGENCRGCGTPLERIVIRGRGTYLCPACQRL
jgi:formamidopyrimidine-DNA glycosylase